MASEGDDVIICRCEEVTRGEILEAIAAGAMTVDEVKKRTRAGMGLCQAKTCRRLVTQFLQERTGQPPAAILPATFRPPARPMPLGALAAGQQDEDDGR